MSDPSAPSSKLREQMSRKKCPDKHITAKTSGPVSDSMASGGIKLQGIRLLTSPIGIMLHGAKLLSINDLSRDLFLPIIVANPSPTNPGPLKAAEGVE
jgi:hypothetical protein